MLLNVISSQQTSKAILFSSLSIVIYDHLLLLHLETVKIWKAKWTPVKFYYVVNRIITLLLFVVTIMG
jgi:hypothetical protein